MLARATCKRNRCDSSLGVGIRQQNVPHDGVQIVALRDELPQSAPGGRKRVTLLIAVARVKISSVIAKVQSCPVAPERPLQSLFMSPPSAPGSAYRPFLSVRRLRGDRGGQPSKSTILRMRSRPCAGSGNGYSRNSYFPGSTSVAASTPWADMPLSFVALAGDLAPAARFWELAGNRLRNDSPPGLDGVARIYFHLKI